MADRQEKPQLGLIRADDDLTEGAVVALLTMLNGRAPTEQEIRELRAEMGRPDLRSGGKPGGA